MQQQRTATTPPWLKRLGTRIRQARRIRGLTQTDAAGPDLTKSFISLLESGRTYPSVGTLVALASRLQTSLACLLLDEAELPRETALNLLALARKNTATPSAAAEPFFAAVDVLANGVEDLRAELLLTRGDLALLHGQAKDAEKWFEGALDWSRRQRLRTHEPRALARLAQLALSRKDLATARGRLDQALTLYRTTRTLRSADGCEALILQGRLLGAQAKIGRALQVFAEVAEVAQRHHLPHTLGNAYRWMGALHAESGQLEQALATLRRARDALEPTGESDEFAQVLHALGKLSQEAGNFEEAYASFQQALRIQEHLGAAAARAATLTEVAVLEMHMGKPATAEAVAKEALELARAQHDVVQSARSLMTMARIARAQRRWKAAAGYLRDAVESFRKAKRPKEMAEAARELGMLLKERGEHAAAADYLAIALSADPALSTAGDVQYPI